MLISFVLPTLTDDLKVLVVNDITNKLYGTFNGVDSIKSVEFVGFRERNTGRVSTDLKTFIEI